MKKRFFAAVLTAAMVIGALSGCGQSKTQKTDTALETEIAAEASEEETGIYLTDICQELIAKPLTFRCSFYKSCNIHKFNNRMNCLCRIMHLCGKWQQPSTKAILKNRD